MENGDRIRIHEDVAALKTDMGYVKSQVTNHIPTSIKDMNNLQREEHKLIKVLVKEVSDSVDGIKQKLAYYAGGIAVIIIVLEIFLKLIK